MASSYGLVALQAPTLLERALDAAHLDFPRRAPQPSAVQVVLATVLSVVGALAADALLVAIGTAAFPTTKGYGHFQFSDYGKLTVVGVLFACAAWPMVTRVTSSPRWVFSRMAVLVTLVLWLPDVYLLMKGEPVDAVAVLMAMHVAIALVTYNVLVHVAAVPAPLRSWP